MGSAIEMNKYTKYNAVHFSGFKCYVKYFADFFVLFQTLCDKVFLGGILKHGYVGLLDSPPYAIKFELRDALDLCTNPPVSEVRKLVSDSCQSTFGWSSQENRLAARNSSYADHELECPDALQKLRNLLAEETNATYKRLKEILLRTK